MLISPQLALIRARAGGSGGAGTTWNPADLSAGISLSNGNLTATGPGSDSGVRSTTSRTSGLLYCELTASSPFTGGDTGAGIASAGASLTGIGGAGVGGIVAFNSGSTYYNGSFQFTVGAMAAKTLCMSINLTAMRAWLRLNGTGNYNNNGTADPATNTGGLDISAVFGSNAAFLLFCCNGNGSNVTINATGPFTYTVPSGFSAWG